MPAKKAPRIPLPKAWTRQVRSAMLYLISLAQYVTVYTRSWAVDSMNGRVRLKAENDRLRQEIALLREETLCEVVWSPDGTRLASLLSPR